MIDCCANLVILNAKDGCVRFAHSSVKQYLEKNQSDEDFSYFISSAQDDINCDDYCVAYLFFSNFGLQLEKIDDMRLAFQSSDLKTILTNESFEAIASIFSKLVTSRSDQKRNSILLK